MNVPKQRKEKARLILTLELAVVLPAAALVLVSAWYLNSIRRDRVIEAAFQRDFLHFLMVSEKQFNTKAYELVDTFRADLTGPNCGCAVTLDKALIGNPYAAHVFMYNPKHGMVARSQPRRLQEDSFKIEADDFTKMMNSWVAMEYQADVDKLHRMEAKGGPPYFFFMSHAPRGNGVMLYESVAMFLVRDNSGNEYLSGMAFDADFLKDKFLPQMMDTVMSRSMAENQDDKNPAVMMLHMRGETTPMAKSAGWDGGDPEVERNLEGAFPGLVGAIKLRGTTLEAIGQRFMRTSILILAVLSLLLAGGIILTHRNVSKEMALARLKSDFVSNVSHELRTPLSLIRLYAETLELGRISSPEKYQEYFQTIRKESERLTALINNILDFSRIEAGKKEYDFRETDMKELVRNTLESYRFQIEQNGFTFEEKIDESVPPLKVDREAMARSLLNLVNNALKYSLSQKYIGVNLYRHNGSVKLEVVDHGIGIAPHEQQKIFEKFYRVGDPLVHNTKGSGLGLSLVRHIVSAHGGNVSVDSEPGHGSKFIITLPLQFQGKPATA